LDEHFDEMVELLFDLSSNDRLTLLFAIRKGEKLRLTHLAGKIGATIQETSRHVGRLIEAKLIERYSDGSYILTSYGRLTLHLLSSYGFLSKNRDYFLSHDVSFLPQEFIERVGELFVYEYATNVSTVLRHTEQVITSANEYVWLMADQALMTGTSVSLGVTNNSVSVRVMIPKSSLSPQQYQQTKTLLGNKFELKVLADDDVKVAIAMNEKIAGIAFPDLKGRMDFDSGFINSSNDFHKWCNDVFIFYWNRSKKPFLTSL
jgi:predicted transcriptional regulator